MITFKAVAPSRVVEDKPARPFTAEVSQHDPVAAAVEFVRKNRDSLEDVGPWLVKVSGGDGSGLFRVFLTGDPTVPYRAEMLDEQTGEPVAFTEEIYSRKTK